MEHIRVNQNIFTWDGVDNCPRKVLYATKPTLKMKGEGQSKKSGASLNEMSFVWVHTPEPYSRKTRFQAGISAKLLKIPFQKFDC